MRSEVCPGTPPLCRSRHIGPELWRPKPRRKGGVMSRWARNGKRVTGLAWIVVCVAAVAACTDALAPPTRRLLPSFSYSPNGAALDQFNGALGENGTLVIKGFNPTNPHHGDAIIATFSWLVSTNIIDSVSDVLTTAPYTPVGNKYTLVEYVTAGGYSMATYVATNVQNFPDPNTGSGDVLAVAGYLSQSVTDAGVSISAWSGVEDNFALALGEHRSATGSAATTTTAHAGGVAIDAGALLYTVTMGALAGLDKPAGFTSIGQGADNFLKQETAYLVQASAGSVDPGWTWFYGPDQSTWLVTTLALKRAPPPTGDLTATTTSSGSSIPSSGYTVTVDGSQSQTIAPNGQVTFSALDPNQHSVNLSGVATNCTVNGADPTTVVVPAGGIGTTTLAVTCEAPATDFITGGGRVGDGRELTTFGLTTRPDGGYFEWVQHCPNRVDPASSASASGPFTFHGSVSAGTYLVSASSPHCRKWTGTGAAKETGSHPFSVTAGCDNGEPGRGADYIEVRIDGYHYTGYLSGGNIQLHKGKS